MDSASVTDAPTGAPPAGAPRRDLDVRPVLAAGQEPFSLIMEAVETLPDGAVLALRAPFEPKPLHRVLGAKGFAHSATELAEGDWETLYWRADGDAAPAAPAAAPSAEAEVVLDVRGLQPPEPMERTLAALESLPPGGTLVQINDRVPAFLLPLLDERGYGYAITQDDRGTITTIRRSA
ncbi:MAG: DUF2249 domain-containing protein [Actinomycetota bacterium]